VVHPFLDHDGPLAIAHRGGALDGRENSMAAFARAVELGYRYLETDVHVTADGVLIAFHDDRLDRVTDRTGEVESLSWREVRAARIAGVEPIPLFADILASWPHVRIVVDPKSDRAVEPLVQAIRAAGALDRVCIGSFSDRRLRSVRAALGSRLCTSMGPVEVLRLRMVAWGLLPRGAVPRTPACVQIPVRRGGITLAEPRLVAYAHTIGRPVHVWTVNDPDQMRALLDLGADGIISDDLVALRAARKSTVSGAYVNNSTADVAPLRHGSYGQIPIAYDPMRDARMRSRNASTPRERLSYDLPAHHGGVEPSDLQARRSRHECTD
jgi:glycerophosphoryl diester phosphodiesterase